MVGLIGCGGGAWRDRLALLQQMLLLAAQPAHEVTGYLALTARNTRIVTDKAIATPHGFTVHSNTWRSLPRSRVVVGYASSLSVSARVEIKDVSPVTCERYAAILVGKLQSGRTPSSLLESIERHNDPASSLSDMLDDLSGSFAAAVLDAEGRLLIARRGIPLWLHRFRGDTCWLISPSGQVFEAAVRRLYGPMSPLTETSIAVQDETLLTATADGSVFLNSSASSPALLAP